MWERVKFFCFVTASVKMEGTDESLYHENRVKWGIPEGPEDLPFGNCLPLECNLVYMNGGIT